MEDIDWGFEPPANEVGERDRTSESLAFERDARALAKTHLTLERAASKRLLARASFEDVLDHAQKHFAENAAPGTEKAAEWFLDNDYLIRRAARQVSRELPKGFANHLPRLAAGPESGWARVHVLARTLVVTTRVELDASILYRFVQAYQEIAPLTIAELWALPTMLRLSVLHMLLDFLVRLGAIDSDSDRTRHFPSLEPTTGVERTVRALRLLADIDWKVFFERVSRVEAILRTDPTGIYARMDFETCDAYRKAVEDLAWNTRTAEDDVAAHAIALAREGGLGERERHVGYYLIDAGRAVMEGQLGYERRGIDRVRYSLKRWATASYLSLLAALTAAPLLFVGSFMLHYGARWPAIVIGATLAALPASLFAITLVQWAMARILLPRTLPKLDFSKGIPEDARTLVVIPTLLGQPEDVDGCVRQIELHYLSNPDPRLRFALLTDDIDSRAMPQSVALLEIATRKIHALNAKHGGNGYGPFHLLHREARWNAAEGRFMGWERKRGKLEELNRLLRGDSNTSYTVHVGAPGDLENVRFVITLDSDTELPMGCAHRLIGLLAHPLNHAVFDAETGRITSGYALAQPRIETSPSASGQTRFSRTFAGDAAFDIYTHAVSDLYQDLFGSGIYVGKGIYDVDAFMRSLHGRVPENSLASHDLFEGIHARTALASDIVLFEGYPHHYLAYARRMHRWVRGDWQLLPWLFPKVPSANGERLVNPIALIDRWKIVDNLRRSLLSPVLFLLLLSAWTWLPGPAHVWTLGVLGALLVPMLPAIAHDRTSGVRGVARWLLAIAFLAHEAVVVTDAVVRVLVRMTITRKHLLQWVSASQTARTIHGTRARGLFWREMLPSVLLALASLALVAWTRAPAIYAALPILLAWVLAPEIAGWLSRPASPSVDRLQAEDRRTLRLLARRTWLFFEMLVGPNDQWLPVDNYQEAPREQTAHRTSPTNIGMMLLSVLSAYDLGYVGPSELSLRLRMALESVARLAHYQGHLLNWYETKNLEPLLPRYVSTVDSGNFAGCLLALAQGCRTIANASVMRAEVWDGLFDTIALLEEAIASRSNRAAEPLHASVGEIRMQLQRGRHNPQEAYAVLRGLCDEGAAALDRELLLSLEAGAYRHEPQALHGLRTWIDRFHHQLHELRRELELLLPWVAWQQEAAAEGLELPVDRHLNEIPEACQTLLDELDARERDRHAHGELAGELRASAGRLRESLRRAATAAESTRRELLEIASGAESEARGMDFRLLFDRERKLFHIGYNVTLDRVDPHHYDLLASEARLASYLAIVKHDVPESHWYALGRPLTHVADGPALLSWGGTMFEYLMPALLMHSNEQTLLGRTCERAVRAQMTYGERKGVPWGISESAYAHLDAHQTYQYRSFGVPGLGFKRGLEDDLVLAPYASMLAVSTQPRAVIANLAKLASMGTMGVYGLYEAVDFRPNRVEQHGACSVVYSYMAHHQGMILVALNNALNEHVMVRRFHANPSVETGTMLLNERLPAAAPLEGGTVTNGKARDTDTVTASSAPTSSPWSPAPNGWRQAIALSNGRLTSIVTDCGAGGLRWRDLALTYYQPDPTCDEEGTWIHLRDEDTGRVWRATSDRERAIFHAHAAEFHRREQGISVRVDVTIAPTEDVEVRQITLHNETNRPRRLTVTSVAEPAIVPVGEQSRHPAFTKLFLESESVADLDALLFARRSRSAKDERAVLVHRFVHEGPGATLAGYETDRAAFVGRCERARAPQALVRQREPLRGRVGAVLDPIMSLMATVELRPMAVVTLAFVTAVGRSRSAALDLARRYGSMHAVRWAFRDAEQESLRRLQRMDLEPALLPSAQRLSSVLLFSDPALRASSDILALARPCKSRLWGRSISGDDPIVLVRVHDAHAPLVRELIATQSYLRSCGIRFDLVLVDEQASGYVSDGTGTLRSVLAQHRVEDWINRRGGIFVVPSDQISVDERHHLEASARAVFETRQGPLTSQLTRAAEARPNLPRFEPTLADTTTPGAMARPKLLFDNGIGGFSEDGREYVLKVGRDEPTPAPWCNVLANAKFGCMVSESSLGSTWSLNSGENRLTPWRNDPVLDTPSEVLYLRDEETAVVWSPTPLPAGQEAETLVRHGAGYTTYERESHGLEQRLTVFTVADAPLKVVRLRLRNTLGRRRRLTATYYAEWVLGGVRDEQRPYIVSDFTEEHGCLRAACSWNAEFAGRVAFLASERNVHGFTTDRTEFLGRGGDYSSPDALGRWGLSRCLEAGVDPCAALQVHLELAPDEVLETHFVLGQAENADEALDLVARFRERASIDEAWRVLTAFWDDLLGNVHVRTPDPAMDLMLNRWLLYQSISSRLFGRTGFYQSSGAFGYRDQLQDVLALLHAAPERTRAHILEAARHQFEEGDVLHWWHDSMSGRAPRGVRTRCSDDLLWLPYVTTEYVHATGDTSILSELVPFLAGEPLEREEHDRYAQYDDSPQRESLFEHCRRALVRGATRGAHNLPLMGDGDWNDGMNHVGSKGRGESVWLGWFLYTTMVRFAALCERTNDRTEAARWRDRAEPLRAAIEEGAWDGGWYLRAFHDDGSLLGSGKERECRIDSIAQSWAALSGAADAKRVRLAVRAAETHLVCEDEKLVLLLWPPFDRTPHDPGYIRAYPPGIRENGGQYSHAATWLGWAHAALGDGAGAERIFRLLNPILRTRERSATEQYRVEPYVLAGDIYAGSSWRGRGGWTWYTGAAAWAWRLGVEAILGLRMEGGRLRVEPCIPPAWKGFEAWLRLGKVHLHVIVENTSTTSQHVMTRTLDGVRLDSNLVGFAADAEGVHELHVLLSSRHAELSLETAK